MDATRNEVIVYDDSCPMCRLYTAAFVRHGLLDPDGRVGFSNVPDDVRGRLDLDRARREIPLCDRATGQVRYGLDALFHILGARFPLLGRLFRVPGFKAAWMPVYLLISYNRRQIAGSPPPRTGFDCGPDFRAAWWIAWMAVAALLAFAGLRVAMGAAGPWAAAAFLAPPAAWWLALAFRSAHVRDLACAAGQAAASLALGSLILLAGSPIPGRAAAISFLVLAWIAMAHQLWRRRWLFRKPAAGVAGA